MDNKNKLLQVSILIIFLLAVGIAFLRTTKPQISSSISQITQKKSGNLPDKNSQQKNPIDRWNLLKTQEFLGEDSTGDSQSPTSLNSSGPTSYSPESFPPSGGSNRPSSQTHNDGNVYSSAVNSLRVPTLQRRQDANTPSLNSGNASGNSKGGGATSFSGNDSQITGVHQPTAQEYKNQMFNPFLGGLTKDQASSLERTLGSLSNNVERAILQAMLPKSKKDANIEKYLQRNRADSSETSTEQSSGPFAGVLNQIKSQKANIMKSMGNAYGAAAAKDAGKVMDSYQKELGAALSNTTGKTSEEVLDQARALSKKYNKQLEKVSQKHGIEKFKQDSLAKDTAFLNNIEKAYGSEIASKMGETFATARQRELELAQSGLPMDEYYQKLMENQRLRRQAAEQLLQENGQSLKPYLQLEDEEERKGVEDQLQQEESGKALPLPYQVDPKEREAFDKSLTQERDEKVQIAEKMYGETGARLINNVYDQYAQKTKTILENPETSPGQKKKLLMDARQEANRQIDAIQSQPEMQQLREDNQVESTLSQLMKDPAFANATDEQRTQFQEAARPVLHEMYFQINKVAASNLPEAEKQRQIQAIQDRAQRRLSGG